MNIAVFCSANARIDSEYFERAKALGEWMARNGHILVFGGSNQGLMRCISDAVKSGGGRTIGVHPEKFEEGGKAIPDLDVLIHCADLAERKELMLQHADAVVILPGGVGTLDELFTTLADTTLGYHNLKVIIYNINGFWDSLMAMIRDLTDRNTLRPSFADLYAEVTTLEELTEALPKQQ